MEAYRIILASASPRRKELLSRIGLTFEVIPSQCDEDVEETCPEKMVQDLSRMKAEEVWERTAAFSAPSDNLLVIGADTIVVMPSEADGEPLEDEEKGSDWQHHQNFFDLLSHKTPETKSEKDLLPNELRSTENKAPQILGKPRDEADALRMLTMLQGRKHQVFTGVTFVWKDENGQKRTHSFYEKTDVFLYPMDQEEILGYIRSGDPMDKAGAYGIQGPFAAFVRGIRGDYNNVVGLPVGRVYQELKRMGKWSKLSL